MAPARANIDGAALCAHIEQGGTVGEFATLHGLHATTIHNRIRQDAELRARYNAAQSAAAIARGHQPGSASASPTLDVPEGRLRELKLGEVAALLRENQLNPDQWTIDRAVVNKWGQPGEESRQVKVQMRPRTWVDDLRPGLPPLKVKTGRRVKPRKGEPQVIVALGDHHAPYHEKGLHAASLELIRDIAPHRIVHTGDGPDYPTLSEHKDSPAMNASPQECADAFVGILRDIADVAPQAERDYLPGNHCLRPRNYVLKRAPRVHGLRAGGSDDGQVAAMDPRVLYRLDELGFNYVAPPDDGEYYDGQLLIGNTMFLHGWITGKGASRRQSQKLGWDVVHGHDHKAGVERVKVNFKGQDYVFTSVATGCMAGSGHARYMPLGTDNEHQAFVVATIWPDGEASYEHARWDGSSLRYRSDRYTG